MPNWKQTLLLEVVDEESDKETPLTDDALFKFQSSTHSIRTTMHNSKTARLLPPIVIDPDTPGSSTGQSPLPCKSASRSDHKQWSKYHSGCVPKGTKLSDRSHEKKSSMHGKHQKLAPLRTTGLIANKALDVVKALDTNATVLEQYVTEKVSFETVQRWYQLKKREYIQDQSGWKISSPLLSVEEPTSKFRLNSLLESLDTVSNEAIMVWELSRCISTAVEVDAFRICQISRDAPEIVQYFVLDNTDCLKVVPKHLVLADPTETTLLLKVASRGRSWRCNRYEEAEFPNTPFDLFKAFKLNIKAEANFIMYQPILNKSGQTAYVIEFWRINEEFTEKEEEISSNFQVWGNLALHYCNLYLDMNKERNMTNFLLDVVKAIFEEMVSLDQVIKRILEFAQKLVNADRASLFLVDYRNFELVSTVFDLKFESVQDRDMAKKEIRMPINRGIAGHVAMSGESMNIPDAYSDYRFNRSVDEVTGYKTVSILCMPIKVQGKVIGVVQMVNKRDYVTFDQSDEGAFEIFATFFGLALHHARLYDKIVRKEQKYRVALEVLSYHNTCRENEVQAVLGDTQRITVDLDNFYLDPYQINEFSKCKMVINMFSDLFDITKFDVMTVVRFVLTVKKNYRTVPYHNFDHGWSVAHTMYVILKNDKDHRFDYKTRLALFVASLCHDLDHRGYTNKYMSETASPLAAMYTTSTLEHHHFNITVTILQQDGHNIFSHLSSDEYKDILSLIKLSILATDLAAFFPNLAKMKELLGDQVSFDWDIRSHRELAMAISMTSADLSASAKPWKIQIKTVRVIFEEFYDQGDKEKAGGKEPIPMMDRCKPEEQPSSQVGFLGQICLPCYNVLRKILPNTNPMYKMALKNLRRWEARASRVTLKNSEDVKEILRNNLNLDSDNDEDYEVIADVATKDDGKDEKDETKEYSLQGKK